MSYRTALDAEALSKAHTHSYSLARLMQLVGEWLAAGRGTVLSENFDLPNDSDIKSFFKSALGKRAGWLKKLFGITDFNKQKGDIPFWRDRTTFRFLANNKNAPIAVRIKMDGKTIDSRSSPPADFDAVPKAVKMAAKTGNYAIALGEVVVTAATDFQRRLAEYGHPVESPFKYAKDTLNKVRSSSEPTCLDMHMMSVIPPSAWYLDNDWSGHHRDVRKLAERAGANNLDRRQRRIHVLEKALLDDPVELVLLADLMLYDLRYRVESRVLAVKRDAVTPLCGIPSVDGLLLMDYGIFSDGTGSHQVIISDIEPFGTTAPSNFQIYSFPPEDLQALYYFKRHTWHNAWWGKAKGAALVHTVDVLKRVQKLDVDLTELPSLWFFKELKRKEGVDQLLHSIQKAIGKMLTTADAQDGRHDELKFRKWFEGNWKTFRETLKANDSK